LKHEKSAMKSIDNESIKKTEKCSNKTNPTVQSDSQISSLKTPSSRSTMLDTSSNKISAISTNTQDKKIDQNDQRTWPCSLSGHPIRTQSRTWARLDNPQDDETLKYLAFDTPTPKKVIVKPTSVIKSATKCMPINHANYGKDGKQLKKSPKIIDPKAALLVSPKRKIESKPSRGKTRKNTKSSTEKQSIVRTNPIIISSQFNELSTNVRDIVHYEKQIRSILEDELSVLGEEVKNRLCRQIGSVINDAVVTGIRQAFNFGLLKLKEQFSSKHHSPSTTKQTAESTKSGSAVNVKSNSDEKENKKK